MRPVSRAAHRGAPGALAARVDPADLGAPVVKAAGAVVAEEAEEAVDQAMGGFRADRVSSAVDPRRICTSSTGRPFGRARQ
jgi:hypothetical protein